jgi:hypothetical protein
MIQSLPRAAGCYATTTQFLRELREGQVGKWASGQVGAIAGRSAHDHWMNSPSTRTHTTHYSPVMIAPLLTNASQCRLQAWALFFVGRDDSGRPAAISKVAPAMPATSSLAPSVFASFSHG